jgi:hypothetical protein
MLKIYTIFLPKPLSNQKFFTPLFSVIDDMLNPLLLNDSSDANVKIVHNPVQHVSWNLSDFSLNVLCPGCFILTTSDLVWTKQG